MNIMATTPVKLEALEMHQLLTRRAKQLVLKLKVSPLVHANVINSSNFYSLYVWSHGADSHLQHLMDYRQGSPINVTINVTNQSIARKQDAQLFTQSHLRAI